MIVAVLVIALGVYLFVPPSGPRSLQVFDADRMADLEVEMWQAYYKKEKFRLFRLLVTMLHEQYHYSWAKAVRAGFHLGRAAATFGDLRDDYERVLPDLVEGYTIARDWTGAKFDPQAVARAELGWWVARRIPGQDSAANVGARIADLYALLYEVPRDRVLLAGLLRAEAGALRDRGGKNADWAQVSALLHRSYASLRAAMPR